MVTQARYEAIIDALYTALEGLDTTEYRWGDEERWTRDFHAHLEQRSHRHLAAGVTLGEITHWGNDRIEQDAAITFACRFHGSGEDSIAQARLQVAQWSVMALLTTWTHGDARSVPKAPTVIEPLTPGLEWLAVSCPFKLHLQRG